MVKILGRAFSYNWTYYTAALAIFVAFWQIFSVVSVVCMANNNLLASMHQNAAYFEKAFLDGDVLETQKIMWRIKNNNIKRIIFQPVKFNGGKWIFKNEIVGNLYNRPYAQLTRNIPLIANGVEIGKLEYVVDLVDVNYAIFKQNYILFITVVIFFLGLLFLSNIGAIKTIFSIERCVAETNALADAGEHGKIQDAIQRNIESLPQSLRNTPFAVLISRLAEVLQRASHLESELAVANATSNLAAQVAHDIRSPLTALDAALKNAAQMPEEQRIILRHAVNRIRDIANNLLEKNRQQAKTAPAMDNAAGVGAAVAESLEVCLLSSLVDPVVTEKRLQFESKPGINIDFELTAASYGLFAKIQPVEFKRLVSNLVNNAVEALDSHRTQVTGNKPEGHKGNVKVLLSAADGKVLIEVKDSGKGIPPEILAKLGQRGETHGKAGGSGLGLFHARTTAESWGGGLVITSELGKGTTVTVKLPAAEPPAWFVSKLELSAGKTVVVLDDDESIHQVWRGRFESARVKEHGIEVYHFSEPDKLRVWVKDNPEKIESAVYLFDYELLGHKETGLSLAEELGLGGKVILVTSRYEEKRIIEGCQRLQMRMIPKGLAGLVPVTAENRGERIGEREETAKQAIGSTPASGVEVLLDDDALVHMTWKMAARTNGIILKAFKAPADFLSSLETFPKDTPIYIDSELGEGIKGEDIAKTIHARGFKTIYLETGHQPEHFAGMPWITKVLSKDPPWGDNNPDS
ncbi:MAG TPA: hypothetical protein DCL44_04685 [Elusimicrobia bacterium]|nr:hypothetical protein [Elusimicrobiota bacterium]